MAVWRRVFGSSLATVAVVLALVLVPLASLGVGTAQASPDMPGATAPPWGAWVTQTVDENGAVSGETSVEITEDGQVHLLYTRGIGNRVTYATSGTGVTWEYHTFASVVEGDLALDSQNRPHVAYENPAGTLTHWVKTASGWVEETVDTDADFEVELVLDSQDRPHIVFEKDLNANDEGVGHAWKTSDGSWSVETISTTWLAGLDAAIDSQDRVHATWGTSGKGRYAVKAPGGSWQITKLAFCTPNTSVDVDTQDRPHVACFSPARGLVYYHKASGGWVEQTVEDGLGVVPPRGTDSVGLDASIAVDEADRPHISWRTRLNTFFPTLQPAHLYYSSLGLDGSWFTEGVDQRNQDTGGDTAVALTPEGQPLISYTHDNRVDGECEEPVLSCFDLRLAFPAPAAGSVLLPPVG